MSTSSSSSLAATRSRGIADPTRAPTSSSTLDEWTSTLGDERLTVALLDRLTHRVHILEMNAPSYRLTQSRARRAKSST
jgi:DNA replication protein DnaC